MGCLADQDHPWIGSRNGQANCPFIAARLCPYLCDGEKSRHSEKARESPEIQGAKFQASGPRCSRSGRRWRNCSIPRSIAARAGLAPAPGCSRRRTIPGTAVPAAKPPRIARGPRRAAASETVAKRDAAGAENPGLGEAPQREFAPANYGTAATIPTLDPELAKQLGFTTEEEDAAAMARPPRNKMEALGVAATADALEALIRDGRPEFKGEDGQVKIWTPHRPPRPEKSEGGVAASSSSPNTSRRATSRPRSPTWSRASSATTARRCCSASPARARPTPWPR